MERGRANESGRGFGSGIVRAATLSALAVTIERVIPEPPDRFVSEGIAARSRRDRRSASGSLSPSLCAATRFRIFLCAAGEN